MEKQTELRIFTCTKEGRTAFKKKIELPLYLSDIDSFTMFIYKQCGSHLFHIEFQTSYGRWLKLCDIKIKRKKKTGMEYHIPNDEDTMRLRLLLEKNRKSRSRLKLAESISTGKPKIKKRKVGEEFYYD